MNKKTSNSQETTSDKEVENLNNTLKAAKERIAELEAELSQPSQREKDLANAHDALLNEKVKLETENDTLRDKLKDEIKPSGMAEVDTMRAEMATMKKKVDAYDALEVEYESMKNRLRRHEIAEVAYKSNKPIELPPAFSSNTQLVSGTFYKLELDGIDPDIPVKALLIGTNLSSQNNMVVLYVGDEPPVILPDTHIGRLSGVKVLEENGEYSAPKRVVLMPTKQR
jgi:regulator of replication initiation timing